MELGQGFYVLLGIIFFLGLMSLLGNIQLASFYRKKLTQLQEYERREQFNEDSPRYNKLMDEIISEYKKYRSQGIEQVNTQALMEHKVYQQQLPLLGILRLPVGVFERIIHQIPSWTIILGLLGTFTGLTMALFAMQHALLQLSSNPSAEMMTISTIITAISEPFKGMSFAFLTSIAGIGVAFFLHVFHSGLLAKMGLGPSYAHLKHLFLTRLENYLDHYVQLQVQSEKPKDHMERLLDRLVEKVRESFDQSVASFGQEIVKMTQKLEGSVQGLGQVIQQSQQFTEEFHQGTVQLQEFGQTLQSSISSFQTHEQQVAGRLEQLSKYIQSLQKELHQLSAKSLEGHKGLEKIVERSDQVIQQSMRKSEEMFKFFHQHNEEMQRRFQERFEEYQRQSQSNQEEWQYRYQEKSDQFSRAAEAFAHAIHHLEREWVQSLEKHLGRGPSHQQDRELREVIRELEGIHHVLEREFQFLHRFSQEMTPVVRERRY